MFDLPSRMRRLLPMLASLALGAAGSQAAPISAGTTAADGPASALRSPLDDRDFLGGGLNGDALADLWRLDSPGEVIRADTARFSNARQDARHGAGVFDALLGVANVAPAMPAAGRAISARPARTNDPLAAIDLGPEARQWTQDAFRSIVDSVLELDVDARGRAAFSVLGMGEFGIAVSGDRNQIAFLAGEQPLYTVQRTPEPAGGFGPGFSGGHGSSWNAGASAPAGWMEGSPLRKVLELVLEIATHPLSLLVYLIIAAYVLLWNVMNRRTRRRSHHSARQAGAHSEPASTRRTRKRRHRVRRQHRHA